MLIAGALGDDAEGGDGDVRGFDGDLDSCDGFFKLGDETRLRR
jgi:hypothetical protein